MRVFPVHRTHKCKEKWNLFHIFFGHYLVPGSRTWCPSFMSGLSFTGGDARQGSVCRTSTLVGTFCFSIFLRHIFKPFLSLIMEGLHFIVLFCLFGFNFFAVPEMESRAIQSEHCISGPHPSPLLFIYFFKILSSPPFLYCCCWDTHGSHARLWCFWGDVYQVVVLSHLATRN